MVHQSTALGVCLWCASDSLQQQTTTVSLPLCCLILSKKHNGQWIRFSFLNQFWISDSLNSLDTISGSSEIKWYFGIICFLLNSSGGFRAAWWICGEAVLHEQRVDGHSREEEQDTEEEAGGVKLRSRVSLLHTVVFPVIWLVHFTVFT